MNCTDSQLLIQKSLDEPLSPAERGRLDSHLAGCADCRKAWDDYHRLSGQATAFVRQAEYGGGDLADRVMAAIAGEAPQRQAQASPRRPFWTLVRTALVAASLAAAAALWAYAVPAGWKPDVALPAAADLARLQLPALALQMPDPNAVLRSLGSLFAPLLPWAGLVIAVAAAANVALFYGAANSRRGTPV